jgi:hypothetical protein
MLQGIPMDRDCKMQKNDTSRNKTDARPDLALQLHVAQPSGSPPNSRSNIRIVAIGRG